MPLLRNLVLSVPVTADHAREVCAPTSLVPDTRQIALKDVRLTCDFTCQPFAPIQGNPDSFSSHRIILLVLWYACWAIIAFFLHIFVGRYLSKPRDGAENRPRNCPYRIPTRGSRAGLSPSILEEDSPPLPFATVGDDDLANILSSSTGRGRQSAAIGSNDVQPCFNPLAGQVSTQNCLRINESDAPTGHSHYSTTSQILLNLTPSTSWVPRDSVLTSHSGARSPITQGGRVHPARPVSSQSDAVLNTFHSFPTETTPLLMAHPPQSSLPPSSPTNTNAVEPELTDPEETRALFASLFPITDLTGGLPTKWFILVVAVTCKEHRVVDPELDLAFLQKVFGQSKSKRVRFEWLAEEDATLENIQAKLEALYREAQETGEPFQLCVYLTGMGDGNSKMCLFGGEVVSEQELGHSTLGLHSQATANQYSTPISVIFDFCREAMKPRDSVDHKLAIVWSSSIGEPPSAYAYPLGDGLPTSCFLIAVFSAAHDVRVGPDVFEDAIRLRFKQLGDFLQFCYRKRHEVDGLCKRYKDPKEECYPPPPQVPQWDSAGLSMLTALGELIRTECSGDARRVSAALALRMEQRGFSTKIIDLPSPSGSNQVSSFQEVRPTWRLRGANRQTSQTMRHTG